MSQVFFISDLHIAHRNVLKFADEYRAKAMGVETIAQHDQCIFDHWNDAVTKRDLVYVLGDLGWGYDKLKDLPGHKVLILGNHDEDNVFEYLTVFDNIVGTRKYKKNWISHFPITEVELFGRKCLHGHVHSQSVRDSRYVNVSLEMTGGKPIPFQDIAGGKFITWNRSRTDPNAVDDSIVDQAKDCGIS